MFACGGVVEGVNCCEGGSYLVFEVGVVVVIVIQEAG